MKTKIAIRYHVTYEGMGGHFAEDGWSGYNERWKLRNTGLLGIEEVYGYAQALEHIEELKSKVWNGERHYEYKKFQIEIHTIAVTTIPIN